MRWRDILVLVRGGGDLATGVAHRFFQAGLPVVTSELPAPTCIRRAVSFAEAAFAGSQTVEGVTAIRVQGIEQARSVLAAGEIPLLVRPDGTLPLELAPVVLVDAALAKRNLGLRSDMAPVVVALGPGFTAPRDCQAVVETNRGHFLGRVIYEGSAEPDTGRPAPVSGFAEERIVRAPAAGAWRALRKIGDLVQAGETVAEVDGQPVAARIDGVLRGIMHDGLPVYPGMKAGDIDPRGNRENCFTISDKARAVAGGALEAVLHLLYRQGLLD